MVQFKNFSNILETAGSRSLSTSLLVPPSQFLTSEFGLRQVNLQHLFTVASSAQPTVAPRFSSPGLRISQHMIMVKLVTLVRSHTRVTMDMMVTSLMVTKWDPVAGARKDKEC